MAVRAVAVVEGMQERAAVQVQVIEGRVWGTEKKMLKLREWSLRQLLVGEGTNPRRGAR